MIHQLLTEEITLCCNPGGRFAGLDLASCGKADLCAL